MFLEVVEDGKRGDVSTESRKSVSDDEEEGESVRCSVVDAAMLGFTVTTGRLTLLLALVLVLLLVLLLL